MKVSGAGVTAMLSSQNYLHADSDVHKKPKHYTDPDR